MSDIVGKPLMRIDGWAKATGQALYVADLVFPGMLVGKFLGSTCAHGRIKKINLEKAKRVKGVKAIITGRDFPYLHGECIINIPFLAIDKVRYVGEPVVAVAAEDEEAAKEALSLVEVEYEELPAVFDPEEAMREDAPLIHEEMEKYQYISAVKMIPKTNICQHFVLSLGSLEEGFAQSDYIFEDRFTTPQVQHAAIEAHGRWIPRVGLPFGVRTIPPIGRERRLPRPWVYRRRGYGLLQVTWGETLVAKGD